jgi:hypothetical protein
MSLRPLGSSCQLPNETYACIKEKLELDSRQGGKNRFYTGTIIIKEGEIKTELSSILNSPRTNGDL